MRQQAISIGILFLTLPALAGCSTIYGKQNDVKPVHFSSNVASAEITCSSQSISVPGNLTLKQSKTHKCKATAEGYETKKFRVRSQFTNEGFRYSTEVNWAKWGKWTLGIGNLIGWAVDFVSGAMRDLTHDKYEIELVPQGSTGTGKKILNKTAKVGAAILELPKDVTDDAASTVLDSTVRSGAEGIGVANAQKRQKVEDQIEGKKLLERLDEKFGTETTPSVEGKKI